MFTARYAQNSYGIFVFYMDLGTGIFVFCMDLGTNSKFCLTEHKKIGFYNRVGDCLLRGTHRLLMEFLCFIWISELEFVCFIWI